MKIKHFEIYNSTDEVYSLLNKDQETEKLVLMFVNVFAAQTAPSAQHLKESWEEEIGTTISKDAWCKCLYNIQTCSVNARHQIQSRHPWMVSPVEDTEPLGSTSSTIWDGYC